MDDTAQRVLVYILRHDVRLGDNPVFHAASLASTVTNGSNKLTPDVDKQDLPSFTHLLPIYVFPANQVEVSGFIPDSTIKCPYPPAISQVAGLWRTGTHRLKFMAEGVWDLREKLENLGSGSGLQIRVGKIGDVVEDILQWYAKEKDAGRSTAEVAGVCMTSEEGTEEKDDEADVRQAAKKRGINFKLWTDEKYYVDDRDLSFDDISRLPNVYTTFRKSVEPLRECPRPCVLSPEHLPPLPLAIPPQKDPFKIPTTLDSLLQALNKPLDDNPRHGLSSPPTWPSEAVHGHPFTGGETSAQERVQHLISTGAMSSYKATRNGMLGVDYSTKLSAFLAQGHLTARQIHWAMMEFEEGKGPGKNVEGYGQGENAGTAAVRFELLWRDYMRLCARKFGHRMFAVDGIQDPSGSPYHKSNDHEAGPHHELHSSQKRWKYLYESGGMGDNAGRTQEVFSRFRSGRTGIGLIDASNRELFLTGYTSNRARQNVASFLANSSHLGIDWRVGAEWYEYLLIDYDMPSNWGNWQYVAGVGNDPRQGRVFNPVKQALDYDPEGEYIKAWVPELRQIDLNKSFSANKEEIDQQKIMALYQAWKLSESEKENLSLKGVDWVEAPLVKIQFQVGKGRGRGRGRGGQNGGRGRGGRGGWRGRGKAS